MSLKITALTAALLFAVAPAHAGFLDGHQLLVSHDHPSGLNQIGITVGPGVEYTGNPYFSADFTDNAVKIVFRQSVLFGVVPAAPFNGFRIEDSSHTVASFAGAAIDPSSTFTLFDASRIALSQDKISLNFGGLTSIKDATILVTISPVPEPASQALLLAGLAAMGAGGVRRAWRRGRWTRVAVRPAAARGARAGRHRPCP